MRAFVGQSVPRIDGPGKVMGKAVYAADYWTEDMLHLKVLRAPHPHARIINIDTARAKEVPGVHSVVTAADVPWLKNFGIIFKDQEVLVREKTRYMGDALAVVAAETETIARRAVKLIEVDYEPLPVVTDPEEALKPDAPKVHERGYVPHDHPYNQGNLLMMNHLHKGNIEEGFAQADIILENEYRTQSIDHVPLQPESGLAIYNPENGRISLWAATQWLHDTAQDMAHALDLGHKDIQVVQPVIGGAFGRREDISVHLLIGMMAKVTGRPCRMVMGREESMITQSKRHPFIFRYKTGLKKDGTITAWEAEVIGDTGAYASTGNAIVRQALYTNSGPYNIPNIKGTCYTVYTNNTYAGAMRGFGACESAFAYESHMDFMAKAIGMDPVEFRLKNAIDLGCSTANGQILTTSVGVKDTISKAKEAFGQKGEASAPHKRRGVGMGTIIFGCGYGEGFPDHSMATVEVTDKGKILVRTAAADVGQGLQTVLTQIVAEELNVSPEAIELLQGDTHHTKNAGSTSASRQVIFTGNAIKLAAEALRGKIFHHASIELKRHHPELSVVDGEIILHGHQQMMSLAELAAIAKAKGDPLFAEGWYFPKTDAPDPVTGQADCVYVAYTFNTQFVEVEVDIETGQVDVLRVVAAPDVGKALNPAGVEAQSEGGTIMGIGYALMEEQVMRDGRTLNPNLSTYLIPTAMDVPDVKTIIVESGDACGPYGAKGIGEPAMIPTAPAIINAIEDAIGVRITDLPATPEKILAALKQKK